MQTILNYTNLQESFPAPTFLNGIRSINTPNEETEQYIHYTWDGYPTLRLGVQPLNDGYYSCVLTTSTKDVDLFQEIITGSGAISKSVDSVLNKWKDMGFLKCSKPGITREMVELCTPKNPYLKVDFVYFPNLILNIYREYWLEVSPEDIPMHFRSVMNVSFKGKIYTENYWSEDSDGAVDFLNSNLRDWKNLGYLKI